MIEPGRELDALIAEKVMGISKELIAEWNKYSEHSSIIVLRCDNLKPYSTDIAAAWEVVEKIISNGYFISISSSEDGFFCEIKGFVPDSKRMPNDYRIFYDSASKAPHAICLTALKAIGVEI